MVEVHEEVKEEKRRQRKAAMEDKSNPWVEDDESAEEAEIDAVKVKKGDEDKMQVDENEDEDPLDAYMSSLKNSLVQGYTDGIFRPLSGPDGPGTDDFYLYGLCILVLVSKGSVQVEKTENNTENGKVSVVVATRVVATKSKGSARGELVEANQDEPEWSSEDEDESLGDTLQTWTQKQRKLLGI